MNQLVTRGIVLRRTNYGEADRIVTLLTPEQGKISLMARGVRRSKSKLAGGIELFSVSDITYIRGRGDLGTLVSTRLLKYYANIVKDIERVQLGYELIKMLNRATEDAPESDYFDLLETAFASLDDASIDLELVRLWFESQLLRLSGHALNLLTDTAGESLITGTTYTFDYEAMSFAPHAAGTFTSDQIKILRLLFGGNPPRVLSQVQGLSDHLAAVTPLIRTMLTSYIRI
ncbi:MAG: repair protein RecO [Candidatus Saccharibacteria bacterium]|nr:repair protein RecO [Candidatus Saccharibacteria bacterium]